MATQTPNYNFSLPEVDGSEDLWGDLLNQNWSQIDGLLVDLDNDVDSLEDRADALEGRTITAGDGLTGGGDLSADRTIAMGTPGTLDGGTSNDATAESHTHAINATDSRTDSSTATLLNAKAMDDHRTSGDHDARYAQLAGGTNADFGAMPQVGGDPIVESGSNSDGNWTRFADGTALMDGLLPSVDTDNTTGSFGLRRSDSTEVPYPITLVGSDSRVAGENSAIGRWVNCTVTRDDSFSFVTYSSSSSSTGYAGRWLGLGRWK